MTKKTDALKRLKKEAAELRSIIRKSRFKALTAIQREQLERDRQALENIERRIRELESS